jgi:hypothetical protein
MHVVDGMTEQNSGRKRVALPRAKRPAEARIALRMFRTEAAAGVLKQSGPAGRRSTDVVIIAC